MKNPSITIHRAGQGYIGRLLASEEFIATHIGTTTKQAVPQTIFILDRSGSMGSNASMMAHIVIPGLARQYLSMNGSDKIILITFDSVVETISCTVSELETSNNIQCRGATSMSGIFKAMESSLDSSNPSVRIVAISDGQVWDDQQTLSEAAIAANKLKSKGEYNISASAIRLFTSSAQPDTRALASVLQLNTSEPGSVVDVSAKGEVETIIHQIGTETNMSSSGPVYTISSESSCFQNVPWAEPAPSLYITSLAADTPLTIWLSSPPDEVSINGISLDIIMGEPLTHDTLSIFLSDKIEFFLSQLRVLKVIGSDSAKMELLRIVNYFTHLEASMPPPDDLKPLLQDGSLAGRSKFLKASLARQLRSITNTFNEIANDDRVARLNTAQQADYLRQAGSSSGASRNTRALARRAEASGINFDDVVRSEIIAMASHITELDQVDDSDHEVSFYSQATTLDGIRVLVDLAQDQELLNNLTSAQILQLFNIVGIPARGPIGDFPDPMTYRLDKFLYGVYVSVADITTVLSQGGKLKSPDGQEMVTAVPIFEDFRIQKFLQRYARSSLEYISSIGMRRMIADVPKTYPYTICSGLWKLVEELEKGKKEIKIKHFAQLVSTYEQAAVGLFDHIIPLLEHDKHPNKSFFLGHNGITNLIGPILHLIRVGKTDFMARILRALYSFETCQIMRRLTRDGPNARQDALDKLLGVDFSSGRQTPLPPKFTRTDPSHCSEAVIDDEAVRSFKGHMWFVHYATLLEPLLTAVVSPVDGDSIKSIQAVPSMSEATIESSLGLVGSSVSLEDFMVYNMVEGLLYGSKQSRIDKDTNEPKLGDLGHDGVGAAMIRDYVHSRYEADYEARLKIQSAEEQGELRKKLIDELCAADSMSEFVTLLKDGKKRGEVHVVIDRTDSLGFKRLHDTLMEVETTPKRFGKLRLIYSGQTREGEAVFNGGNIYRTSWEPLKDLLVSSGHEKLWKFLQQELSTRGFQYRGGAESANRHGHSNDFMSYFAFGFNSLDEYFKVASQAEWTKYTQNHCSCCGVAEFLAKQRAAAL